MKVVVFDISADYAYFKVPEGTRSNFSFPFPPKTTIMGLLAAIMGKERNKYWLDEDFQSIKIGIELLSLPLNSGIKMNYWRTKTITSIKSRSLGLRFMLPGSDAKNRGFTTQVKFEYLTHVLYRIYVSCESESLLNELERRIRNHLYYYPPYLGHANLLAELSFIGSFIAEDQLAGEFRTLIPVSKLDEGQIQTLGDLGGFELYNSVPVRYRVEQQVIAEGMISYVSIPDEYQGIILPNFGETLDLNLTSDGYRINIEGINYDVCLF